MELIGELGAIPHDDDHCDSRYNHACHGAAVLDISALNGVVAEVLG